MRLIIGTLLAALLAVPVALAAERQLVLEVVMNGRPTGRVGEFVERGGVLYARPSDLTELGFALPPDIAAGSEPIPLSALPSVRAQVNEARQTLEVTVDDTALRPTEIGGASSVRLAPLSAAAYGAVLNYDILGTFTGQQNIGGALLDMRAFSPFGLLQATGLANITPYAEQKSLARLDTTYTYTDPDELRRWRIGDVVTGALAWSRAIRLGGGQLASDFGLRPDLITYPLPVISASTAVPSTVNVLVNGMRQYSGPVQPGPFAVQTLPVVTGAGEVAVMVQDALGRQTLVTMPFYTSTALLKPGLASYSLEAGAVRQNYGLPNDLYAGWAVNGSSRYGLTDWLTLEGHVEATDGLELIGGGAAVQVGTLGVVNTAVSGSTGHGGIPAAAGSDNNGGQVSVGFQRQSRSLSLGVSDTIATQGYRDIAAVNGSPMPRSTLTASLGFPLGDWGGSIGLAYVHQTSGTLLPGSIFARQGYSFPNSQHIDLVTASYSIPVAGRASFYATGYKDINAAGSYGVALGLSFSLGASTSASVGGSLDKGRFSPSAQASKYAQEQNDYGYRLQDQEGIGAHRSAEGEFLSSWGRVSAGVDQSAGQVAERAGASGALVWADGALFASDRIDDSFAIVRTGGVADVPVLYENRPLGTTDSDGQLLVPSLLSYQNNHLSVDATKLPLDIDVGQTTTVVRPPDRSGVTVDFRIRKVNAALLKLQDANGKPVPIGSVAKVEGAEDQPVGFDGEAYVTGLKPTNRMEVVLPNGTKCAVQFDYVPVEGDIPVIGPLRCQ